LIIYQTDKQRFLDDVFKHDLEAIVLDSFRNRTGRSVSKEEIRSWASSLNYMGKVLNDDAIPNDCGVAIEYMIPQTSKRVDFLLTGKHNAAKALSSNNTAAVLGIVFSRLYTLRNQLMHGGATWNSSVNRDQMRDCVKVLGDLVPAIFSIMLDSPDTLWGDAVYPVVKEG